MKSYWTLSELLQELLSHISGAVGVATKATNVTALDHFAYQPAPAYRTV